MKITQKKLHYLNKEFDVNDWSKVEHEMKQILAYEITSTKELEHIIYWSNELLDEVKYKDTQHYVMLSTNTSDEEIASKGHDFKTNVLFKSKSYFHDIELKILSNKYIEMLNSNFDHYRDILKRNSQLFSEKNLKLNEKEDALCLQYRKVVSNVVIGYNGEQLTNAQANKLLNSVSNDEKPVLWSVINRAWLTKKSELNNIFNQILDIRQQIAINCGFENYGEYLHLSHSRFDYSLDDIKSLHDSIEEVLIPELKRRGTSYNTLKHPWVDEIEEVKTTLLPFQTADELVSKTGNILEKIDPEFLSVFNHIIDNNNMDLEPRKGKTTGGFCFPVDPYGSPFICMNVVGRPVETSILIHELGHGVHSVFNSHQKIRACRMFSSNGELAEFAPKFFELLAFDHYNEFYDNTRDIAIAQKNQYMKILSSLKRYVSIDAFEQWIYKHPEHSIAERENFGNSITDRFNINHDWQGYEQFKSIPWYQSQLIVIMPFYIVSYAIAQIGAIKLYKNYKQNKNKTLTQLKEMLRLGFTKPIGDLYSTAGIDFSFSKETLKETIEFISKEIDQLNLQI